MVVSSPVRRGRRGLAHPPASPHPRRTPATTVAPFAVALALLGAPSSLLPTTASAATAAKRCPTVGRTLAFERYGRSVTSRVWRLHGRTYGCTLDGATRPRTRLLTRAKTDLLRLRDDTVAWTTPHTTAAGVAAARVSAYDLTDGYRFFSAVQAVPRRSATESANEGTVEQLRVGGGLFVAWVADGTTVVIGAAEPGDLTLTGPDGATAPLTLDGNLAVAGSYPASPDLTQQLVGSLKVGSVPGDHGDSDDCAYAYETAFTWSTGPGQAFDARMSGTRTTPKTCG